MIFDIILLLIFVLAVVWGAYRGAVRTVLGIVAFLLAGFMAVKIGVYLAPEIYDRFFSESIASAIQDNLPSATDAVSSANQAEAALNALPESIRNLAAAAGIDLNIIQAQLSSYQYSGSDIAQSIEGSVIAPLVTTVCKVLIAIIAFILIYIILRLLICLIDRFFDLPVLGTVNRVLGGVLGAVKGVFLVAILGFLVIILVGMFCAADSSVAQTVGDSRLLEFINRYNPIGDLF